MKHKLRFCYSDFYHNPIDEGEEDEEEYDTQEQVFIRLFELYKEHKEFAFEKPPTKLYNGAIVLTYSVYIPKEERESDAFEHEMWSVEVEYSIVKE